MVIQYNHMRKSLTQIRSQNSSAQPCLFHALSSCCPCPIQNISVLLIGFTLILICSFYETRYTQYVFSQHALSLTAGRSCWSSALLLSFRGPTLEVASFLIDQLEGYGRHHGCKLHHLSSIQLNTFDNINDHVSTV